VEKFGGVPYPPEVTNLTPSLPLDRRGQGSQSTEFGNCCVASMWYTAEVVTERFRDRFRGLGGVDPSVETGKKRDSCGWLLRALQQQG
jgi:hypothetical protein